MKHVILNIPDGKFEFFMELFQSLGLKATDDLDFPSLTEKQIIDQAKVADKQIKQGKTVSHDALRNQAKKW